MADLADVQSAIAAVIASALYPTAGSGVSAAGMGVRIEPGWPQSAELDQAIAAKQVIVSVYASPGMEKNVTRYPDEYVEGPVQQATYTLAQAGQTVTIGGQGTAYPQNLAVFVGGSPYVVTATSQTPAQLAASLAPLMPAGVSVSGPTLTFPAAAVIGALRVGTGATASREVRRQQRQFQISVWAPTPETRVAVVQAFDPVLADLPRLALPDGQLARMIYHNSADNDADQLRGIYRRDLIYTVEFALNRVQTFTQIVAAEVVVTGPYPLPSYTPVIVSPGGALDFTDPNNSGLSALI